MQESAELGMKRKNLKFKTKGISKIKTQMDEVSCYHFGVDEKRKAMTDDIGELFDE